MAKTKVDATHSTHTGIDLPMPGRAPKRRADGDAPGNPEMTSLPSDGAGNDGSPKTKSKMIADMARIMSGMSADQIAEIHDALTEEDESLAEGEEIDVEGSGGKKVIKIKSGNNEKSEVDEGDDDEGDDENEDGEDNKPAFLKKESLTLERDDVADVLKKHSAALFEGEDGLSEDFKKKAATIFEAAVLETINAFAPRYEDAVADATAALVEHLDGYCDVAVNEWLDRNEIAIEESLQVETAQNFFAGLRNLFAEHYVTIPEEKRDLVEEQADDLDELAEAFTDLERRYTASQRRLHALEREAVVRAECADLPETQMTKIMEMVRDLPYDGEDAFSDKVKVIRENYFTTTRPLIVDHHDVHAAPKVEHSSALPTQLDETLNRMSPYRGRR